jgi:hypothetical protein
LFPRKPLDRYYFVDRYSSKLYTQSSLFSFVWVWTNDYHGGIHKQGMRPLVLVCVEVNCFVNFFFQPRNPQVNFIRLEDSHRSDRLADYLTDWEESTKDSRRRASDGNYRS